MAIRQLPSPRWTVPGNSGAVAAGYYVYTYRPGTSTPKATYQDPDGNTANDNPTILDSRGEANIWWDGEYKVLVYDGDKDNGGTLVWSQDNYGEGYDTTLTGNFNLAQNGSFEIDTNGDGEPDNWTVTEYTNGDVSRDSTDQYHGQYSLKFVSTGGSGNGGGYATSDFFEVQESLIYAVNFAIKSSVADIHNLVEVVWYQANKTTVISTSAVYDDAATNPTSWTYKSLEATAPSNARYAKLRVTGAKDDDATSGTCWFDNVAVVDIDTLYGFRFPNVDGDVTASDEELNKLDGVTVATADLNNTSVLDGSSVRGYALGVAFYENKTFDTSSQVTALTGVATSSDGSKMYALDGSGNAVYQYDLSTAHDVSTAAYDSVSLDISGQDTAAQDIRFKPDGTSMYIVGNANDSVFQYTLSTAWDLSTASYSSKSFSVTTQATTPLGLAFSGDGAVMFVANNANDFVYGYDLSTAWDVSTASYNSSYNMDVSGETTAPSSIEFNDDGTLVFVAGENVADGVYAYHLPSPYNTGIEAYTGISYKSVSGGGIAGIAFGKSGRKLYAADGDDNIVYQHSAGFVALS